MVLKRRSAEKCRLQDLNLGLLVPNQQALARLTHGPGLRSTRDAEMKVTGAKPRD